MDYFLKQQHGNRSLEIKAFDKMLFSRDKFCRFCTNSLDPDQA